MGERGHVSRDQINYDKKEVTGLIDKKVTIFVKEIYYSFNKTIFIH